MSACCFLCEEFFHACPDCVSVCVGNERKTIPDLMDGGGDEAVVAAGAELLVVSQIAMAHAPSEEASEPMIPTSSIGTRPTEQDAVQPEPKDGDGGGGDSSSGWESSSSSSEDGDEEDGAGVVKGGENSDAEDGEDGENGGKKGWQAPRTKHELDETAIEVAETPTSLPEGTAIALAARVENVIGPMAVLKAEPGLPPLAEGSLLCLPPDSSKPSDASGAAAAEETGKLSGIPVVGSVAEVFGSVSRPNYSLRFHTAEALQAAGITHGLALFAALDHSEFLSAQSLMKVKGSDASGADDEEPAPEEIEYSDDEQEAEAHRQAKIARREGGKGEGGAGGDERASRSDGRGRGRGSGKGAGAGKGGEKGRAGGKGAAAPRAAPRPMPPPPTPSYAHPPGYPAPPTWPAAPPGYPYPHYQAPPPQHAPHHPGFPPPTGYSYPPPPAPAHYTLPPAPSSLPPAPSTLGASPAAPSQPPYPAGYSAGTQFPWPPHPAAYYAAPRPPPPT